MNTERVAQGEQYMTLSGYLAQVQGLLDEVEGFPGWIVCELAKVSWNRGHCYLELVESTPANGTMAKARGTIWASRAAVLNNIFRMNTGDDLKEGIKVMLFVQVQFSEVYGLSLNVLDMNPSYTLGDMEAQRKATLHRLEREGLLYRNKELDVPSLPYRIAVVSAAGAAGYGDFMKHLSDSGVGFEVELFEAAMQGSDAPDSIADAFTRINSRSAEFDVAVLVRGGGSNLDLVCFDDYTAAKAVALCTLPVISGIGHERDNHICDDVASVRVKTPTGAADFLIQRFADACERIQEAEQRVLGAYSGILEDNINLLDRYSVRISSLLSLYVQIRTESLNNLKHRLNEAASIRSVTEGHGLDIYSRRFAEAVAMKTVMEEGRISDIFHRIRNSVSGRFMQEDIFLERMQILLENSDPSRILDRGYGIVFKEGRKITDILQIEEWGTITILMRDGKATFTATGVKTEKKQNFRKE